MKQKKYLYIVITIIVISIIITAAYLNDKRIYGKIYNLIDEEQINITSSTYTENNKVVAEIKASDNATYIKVNDVGHIVDNNKLFKILTKYKCKKSKSNYFPYTTGDVIAEISIHQNNKPKHIILGNFNIWYETSDKVAYDIIDGDKLLQEILLLVEK
ncbi:hypothetical protein [Geosporobacter ferrireducens]|uniref:Uncharacterized protein n=1 Tax=Geosporobacter ferrireducens TaxID=1424294 RepID=A0A1D8GIA7_9FIRM|nr:hypothetical protein [Geosporobacter ferrireducens]AOT70641.1 hypothetical protein Gferi_14305 [Geosporobacter ferrireducens]MTI57437.1 hypothetical protein [Geosporobacter ferrireducens]